MADVRQLHQSLQASVQARDYTTAAQTMSQLKLALLEHNALIPSSEVPIKVLEAAREILETGALVSIHLHDHEAFSRYYAQLQPFYADSELNKSPSRNQNKIIGLYLLLLLTKQDISEFHTVLELLEGYDDDVHVRYPVMLERWLMEGSYDKVWQATKSSHVPSDEYGLFTETLIESIRDEIATCSEKAYPSLPIQNAKQLLFLDSEGAVVKFVQSRNGWEVKDSVIYFSQEEADNTALSSLNVIDNTIRYAQELETIV
ncbi:hypothetical protein EX30DRAFT_338820 [Ascodesmis nigricans]|uniref:PCI domain-containing protein n=1 Tax=Ascodesmis nigricans TaxID=341454 RepID=A0A4S2N535_9PEZI|nr:hypothetical protein EX30DRAFT_338820 [Ascodesmis nigricans]